jgi:signal-transduction protein with cAMP-binding, CBS, and nucleotidyltransferase domain
MIQTTYSEGKVNPQSGNYLINDEVCLNRAAGALTSHTKWRFQWQMKISELMEKSLHRIVVNSAVQKAAETMGKEQVGSLLVTKEEDDIEIVTERDIMTEVIADKRNLDVVEVKDVMSKPLVTVDKETDPEGVMKVMVEKEFVECWLQNWTRSWGSSPLQI